VAYSKVKRSEFGGQIFPDYYSLEIKGLPEIKGLRDPWDRLSLVPLNFKGLSVLDLGCNFGGMLHVLAEGIRWGVGIDYDPRLINVANALASANLCFYTQDLEKDPLDLIRDMLPEKFVDVVFLLATCAHIKNWEEVIEFTAKVTSTLVFEANGHEHEQLGQLRKLHREYDKIEVLADKGAPNIGARRLVLCRNT
jgi:SAM-dependent methyltransferase